MSSILNFSFAQGDTIAEGITIENSLTGAAPSPDLVTVEILVKSSLSDSDASAVLDRDSGVAAEIAIVDANAWTITFKATSAETAAMTAGRYKIVCTTVDASDNTAEAFRGDFILRARASDPSS